MEQTHKKSGILRQILGGLQRNRLGELLVIKGVITHQELRAALITQKQTHKPLGQVFIEHEMISKGQLRLILGRQLVLRGLVTFMLMGAVFMNIGSKKARADVLQAPQAQVTVVSATQEFSKVSAYPDLLGSKEKRDSNLKAFTKWTGMFGRFERELQKSENAAVMSQWQTQIDRLKGQSMKQMVNAVNTLMNAKPYILDQNNWGQSDYWATPIEFLKRGGDCEDYAIAKYVALRSLGMPEERLRVAIVQDTVKNIPHAVLVAYTDEGAFILDNQNAGLINAEVTGRYKPIFSINRQAWWLHTAPSSTLVASAQ